MPMIRREPIVVLEEWVGTAVWWVLIVGGIVGCLACFFLLTGLLFPAIVLTILTWIAWGVFSSYHWSIRRRIRSHLGRFRAAEGGLLRHTIHAGERVNFQLALDRLRHEDDVGYPVLGVGERTVLLTLVQSNIDPAPLLWEALPRSPKEKLNARATPCICCALKGTCAAPSSARCCARMPAARGGDRCSWKSSPRPRRWPRKRSTTSCA